MKIIKGDKVRILYGADRGKEGMVEGALPIKFQVVVAGINLAKRHLKSRGAGIVTLAKPIDVSKVALICPKCQKPTRVRPVREGRESRRLCRKCQSQF